MNLTVPWLGQVSYSHTTLISLSEQLSEVKVTGLAGKQADVLARWSQGNHFLSLKIDQYNEIISF